MGFFRFIDKLSWPISILATLFNILMIVLSFVFPKWSVLFGLSYLAVGFIVFLYMVLYMRMDYLRFIWGMISGGWKFGWTIGAIIVFIPGVHFLGAIVGALMCSFFAFEFCILFVSVLPITQVFYKEVILNDVE